MKEMTKEQLRIRVAELCGWKKSYHEYYSDRVVWMKGGEKRGTCDLPNFCESLDAMHEAEKTLTPSQQQEYMGRIWLEVGNQDGSMYSVPNHVLHEYMWAAFAPSAEQRARAFCKTFTEK